MKMHSDDRRQKAIETIERARNILETALNYERDSLFMSRLDDAIELLVTDKEDK